MSEVLGLHTTWRDRADYLRGVLFCAVLLGVALVYSFQLTSFLHAKEALLSGALLALAGLACFRGGAAFQGITAYLPLWGMVVFTLLAAHPRVPSRSVEEALRIASLLFAAALVHDLLSRPYWRGRIKQAIMVSAALVAGLGIAQYFGGLPTLFPVFPGYDQRSYSVFGNQDLLGGYLAIALPLYVAGWTTEKPGSRAAVFHNAPAFALVMGGLILSGSRSAWAAAFLGSLLVFPYRRCFHRRVLSMICIVLAASVASGAAVWPRPWERLTNTFAASDTGGRIRLWIWDGTLRMLRDAPWSGVGLGNYAYWSPRYLGEALNAPGGERHAHNELDTPDAHSEPLQCLAESGVIGLVGMAWMLLRLMRRRGPEWGGARGAARFFVFQRRMAQRPACSGGSLARGDALAARGESAASRGRRGVGGRSQFHPDRRFTGRGFRVDHLRAQLSAMPRRGRPLRRKRSVAPLQPGLRARLAQSAMS